MSRFDPIIVASAPLTGVGGEAMIRTSCGLRRAENVRVGDLLVTRDSGLQPVHAVFTMTVGLAARLKAEDAALFVGARAVGPMMPRMPLTMAPDQEILMPAYLVREEIETSAALIPARALGGLSDAAFHDRTRDEAPLYNFGFERHEIISASGFWIASYRPEVAQMGRVDPDLRERLLRRYPALRDRRDPFAPSKWPALGPEAYLPAPC